MKQIAIEWNNGFCYLNNLDLKKNPYPYMDMNMKHSCVPIQPKFTIFGPRISHLTVTAFSWTTGYVKFTSGFHQCLNGFSFSKTIQPIWSIHVSQKYITWLWPHSHGMLTSFNSLKVFVILSVSSLPFTQGSPYLVHTLIMEDICQPEIYCLTLTSFSWYADFIKFTLSFHD